MRYKVCLLVSSEHSGASGPAHARQLEPSAVWESLYVDGQWKLGRTWLLAAWRQGPALWRAQAEPVEPDLSQIFSCDHTSWPYDEFVIFSLCMYVVSFSFFLSFAGCGPHTAERYNWKRVSIFPFKFICSFKLSLCIWFRIVTALEFGLFWYNWFMYVEPVSMEGVSFMNGQ